MKKIEKMYWDAQNDNKKMDEVLNLIVNEYKAECEEIAELCEEEGYPSNGSNYELRIAGLWEDYCQAFPELAE